MIDQTYYTELVIMVAATWKIARWLIPAMVIGYILNKILYGKIL